MTPDQEREIRERDERTESFWFDRPLSTGPGLAMKDRRALLAELDASRERERVMQRALEYWMPDESLVRDDNRDQWLEHIELLPPAADRIGAALAKEPSQEDAGSATAAPDLYRLTTTERAAVERAFWASVQVDEPKEPT